MTNRTMICVLMCLFLAVFANANSETNNWESLAKYTAANPPLEDGAKCTEESFSRIICENDRLIFCAPSKLIASIPCMVNGRPGFCNSEKTGCVAEKPTSNADTQTDCLNPGTKLPDNMNCSKFTFCDKNKKNVLLQCPGGLVYDPNKEQCKDQGTVRCAKIVCPKQYYTFQMIPFPHARNYYVLCYQGIGDVRKCSDNFYTVQKNACKFDCKMKKESGLFRDTNLERCKKGIYYVCTKSGSSYITKEAKCSSGKFFDEKLGICTETDTCEQSTNPPQQ